MDTIQIHYRIDDKDHINYITRDAFNEAITNQTSVVSSFGVIRRLPITVDWWFACNDPSSLLHYTVLYAMESRPGVLLDTQQSITLVNLFCYTMQQIDDFDEPGLIFALEAAYRQ